MTQASDEKYIDGNIPEPYQYVQATLDRFVEINYDAALDAMRLHAKELDTGHIRQQMVDIIRNNPPLKTVPLYFRDGRENYLWYSDFYDDAGKDVFLKQYGKFVAPAVVITPAGYAIELAKIDLPYFKALVDLISLVRLEQEAERIERKKAVVVPEPVEEVKPVDEPAPISPQRRRLSSPTRSYEPKMSGKQLSLLAECINTLGVFVETATEQHLTDLLAGKQPRLFHITNQKQFTYLFDNLRDGGYLTKTWIAVAGYNCDFASSPQGLADDSLHFITSQQFTNCRRANRSQAILGMNTIDEMMERFADQ